ncbi:MAG: tRNA (adenosine(37)-N6)-threonylcarbamoyltransferase complex dimerization subunit type 1 TsaB [bacterium]|nr:tRNA (adenosine(37)-N6)-threonylcarbamoyltransferase complex dimerization subunit type 1 TsaB [bacterium]
MILVIETSGSSCGVALWDRQKVAARERLDQLRHNEILLEQVQDILQQCKIAGRDLGAIAVSIGPGSFTGLRVGLATAKGLCWSWKIPLITVPTLQAIAASLPISNGRITAVLPARAEEVYWAQFERQSGNLLQITSEKVSRVTDLPNLISGETFLLGEGYFKHEALLDSLFGDRLSRLPDGMRPIPLVESVAQLAFDNFLAGKFADLMKAEPFYCYEFPRKHS